MATYGTFVDGVALTAAEANNMFAGGGATASNLFLFQGATKDWRLSIVTSNVLLVNKFVRFHVYINLSNQDTVGDSNTRIEHVFPVDAASGSMRVVGSGVFFDGSANVMRRAVAVKVSSTRMAFLAEGSTSLSTYLGQTGGPTLTLDPSDFVSINVCYEAA
jgi:hypothetical protein